MYLTITLNPSLDKIVTTEHFALGAVNPIEIKEVLPAGRGVDVAKVLRDLGHPVTACGFLGNNHRSEFDRLFINRGINGAFTHIKGNTRSNIHMISEDGSETELLEPSPEISITEWESFLERLDQQIEGCEMIAVCGSVPHGITPQMFSKMLSRIGRDHLPMLIDTEDNMLDVACAKHPKLLKFNREKIRRQLGKKECTVEQIISYADGLLAMGVENVLVSLDKDGALLICADGVYKADAPIIPVKSTIGCGDAMVASIAESLSMGRTAEDMLRHALAISSANCLTLETAKINDEDYQTLLPQITVEKIK